MNPDRTVNIRAREGGVIRNVPTRKVKSLLTPDEVGLDSSRTGNRLALGEDDKAVLGEMRQTLRDVGGEVGQKIFLEGGEVGRGGDVTVKGFKTGKPSWMEVPDKPGEYYDYPEVVKVLETLRQGRWPKTAKQARIAEQLLQETRFDAENEKARLAGWEQQALESETAPVPQPGRDQAIQDSFFAEVDRLAAEESMGEVSAPGQIQEGRVPHLIQTAMGRPTPSGGIDPAPVFYSQLARTIEQKMPNRAAPDQVSAIARSGGVKEDEIKWTGLDDWLKEQKGPVSKQDVVEFLRQNQVEVREVPRGGDSVLNPQETIRYSQLIAKRDRGLLNEADDAELQKLFGLFDQRLPTKFSTWQLPGGESYRELLLTLPAKESPRLPTFDDWWDKTKIGPQPTPGTRAYQIAYDSYEREAGPLAETPNLFRSPHWDEPNVLAHVRFNERTDAQGKKVLFIEEIQSDWHQEGRRKGYRGGEASALGYTIEPETVTIVRSGREAQETHWRVRESDGNSAPEMYRTEAEALAAAQKIADRHGVPPAPFAKAWHELVMKRMLRWSSEHGFDKIAWTTGEQQATRYDLSKQINEIHYQYIRSGDYGRLTAFGKSNEPFLERGVSPAGIVDYVGKDAAQKIQDQIQAKPDKPVVLVALKNVDLKTGGEWAKHLYDEMLPQFLNKYGKKWGARVAETTIPNIPLKEASSLGEAATIAKSPEQMRVWSLDITPEMKHSVMFQGQPLFALIPPLIVSAAMASQRRGERERQPAGVSP